MCELTAIPATVALFLTSKPLSAARAERLIYAPLFFILRRADPHASAIAP